MRRLAIVLALGFTAGPAFADPAPAPSPAKPATCKRTVVGKGLDRHVVCVFDPIIVHVDPPKPQVAVVHVDPRNVVGRPTSGDRLAGLSHQLR
jgi:hypothetical protein